MRKLLIITWFMLSALGMLGAESWTVLVYMAADNNLEQQSKIDINSMESVAQPEGLNLIVQADNTDGAKRYKIEQDASFSVTSPVLQDLGDVNSGDAETLKDFMTWGFAAYPSQRKMMIIWSHGNSWYKGNEAKWICEDGGSRINVYNGELSSAFIGVPKLDVLLFDACSMQSVEIIYEMADLADYIIGSADLVPTNGFPYETIIPLFDQDITSIVNQIPQLYTESYLPGMGINPGPNFWTTTCSTIKTSAMPQFMAKFKEFVDYFFLYRGDVFSIRQQCFEMNDYEADVDVRDLFYRIRDTGLGVVTFKAERLALIWDEMVISSSSTDQNNTPNIGTAALWFPDVRQFYDWNWKNYAKLGFNYTKWYTVLNYIIGDDIAPEFSGILGYWVDKGYLHVALPEICDPDDISYNIWITEGYNHRLYTFQPNNNNAAYEIVVPVYRFGSFTVWATDRSHNNSMQIRDDYSYYQLSIYPNPVRGRQLANVSWLAAEGASGEAKLDIYNIKGQLVISRDLGMVSYGEGSYPLFSDTEFKALPAGRYIVQLHLGAVKLSQKLIIVY